jgi:glycosyltransferase involved in cell wall biosynthesis
MGEHMLALAGELRGRFSLSFVCPPSSAGQSLLDRARVMGIPVLPLDWHESGNAAAILSGWLRTRHVAVFHAHAGIGWEGHAAISAARQAGVASIVRTEHLPYLLTDPEQQLAYRRILAAVDRLICVSHAARDGFLQAGVPARKLRTVRNGVPSPGLRARSSLASRLSLPHGARAVLTVARFEPQKGHRYLLDATRTVLAHHPQVRFVWVGDGPLRRGFEDEARGRGLSEAVRFLGPRSDARDLMRGADLLVLPSLFEGLPLVILEAMAAGLPVVATQVTGTAEAIQDGVSGRLVPPANPRALAAAIVEALQRPALAAAWARAGRERVQEEFSAARMAREVATIYEEVLAARRACYQERRGMQPAATKTLAGMRSG